MLEVLLIRHGQTDWNRERRIMGRRPVPLNARGRRESGLVARLLSDLPLNGIYASPVRRAMETARLIARRRRLPIRKAPEMAEIEYGRWVGKRFDEVTGDPTYKVYHSTPRRARPPGGERMTSVQRRAVRFVERLRKRHRKGGRVVVVSHADVIKAVLLRYLRLDLNDLLKLRVDNCSVSLLWFNGTRERVLAVNCTPTPRGLFARTDQLPVPVGRKRKRGRR